MTEAKRFRSLAALLLCSSLLLADARSEAVTWRTQLSYGASGPTLDLYVPARRPARPAAVVLLHYCSGDSRAMHRWLEGLADRHGFLVLAPGVGAGKSCWNALPARSGEVAAIVRMVDYVVREHGADARRVFVAGVSSGGCMTNALLAAYPEVFAAGSVLAGVPAGAWIDGNECEICGREPPTQSAEAWGEIVRRASPFRGQRPRVQLFHGSSDDILVHANLAAQVLQWTNVLGVTDADAATERDRPKRGWQRTSYRRGALVILESNSGQGQPHDLTGLGLWPEIVRFFGLDRDPDGAPVPR